MTALPSEHASEPGARRSVMGRLFDILDCFAGRNPVQTVTSLCDQTGIPQATVHRMLATLVEGGAVERTGRGQYKLGMRMWRLGWGVPEASDFRDAVRPHLVDLYTVIQVPVTRCVRDGSDVRVMDRIAGHALSRQATSSRRLALGQVAAGHIYLANMSLTEMRAAVQDPAVRATPDLIKGEFALLQRMAEIRNQRLAVTPRRGGGAWIASPVFDGEGVLRCAITAEVPADRLDLRVQGSAVRRTAAAVSDDLRP